MEVAATGVTISLPTAVCCDNSWPFHLSGTPPVTFCVSDPVRFCLCGVRAIYVLLELSVLGASCIILSCAAGRSGCSVDPDAGLLLHMNGNHRYHGQARAIQNSPRLLAGTPCVFVEIHRTLMLSGRPLRGGGAARQSAPA